MAKPSPIPRGTHKDLQLAAGLINVAAYVPCTEAEGPGKRFALWVQGCPLRCPGCCNPHMLEFRVEQPKSITEVFDLITSTPDIEGVTLIGGEPFAQASTLGPLSKQLREHGLSIMVFSGFPLEKIRHEQRPEYNAFLEQIDLLVSGPYLRKQHVNNRRWIGSANQQVHFLTERYQHLSEEQEGWDAKPNTIEIRLKNGQITINGFPHQDITSLLEALSQQSIKRKPTQSTDPIAKGNA